MMKVLNIIIPCNTFVFYMSQVCPLKFGSWSYHDLEINVTNRDPDGDMSSFVENTEWDLLGLPLKRHSIKYGCCPETYPDVTFYVTMKRKPLFYVLNLLFPCLLITAVALLGNWVSHDSSSNKNTLKALHQIGMSFLISCVCKLSLLSLESFPHQVFSPIAKLIID